MNTSEVKLEDILKRENTAGEEADKIAAAIIDDVEKRGDEALFEYCEKFDKVKLTSLEVSKEELDELLTYKKLNMLSRISRLANLWYYTTIIGIVVLILYGIYKIMS
jgi:histidinol dehydrogenase